MNNRPPQDPPSLPRQYPTLEGVAVPNPLKTAIRHAYQHIYDLRDDVLKRISDLSQSGGCNCLIWKGVVATVGDLPTTGNEQGDGWIVESTGHLWVWDGTTWVDAGPIMGPPGPAGPAGPPGPPGSGGSGTVTSVALTVPAEFSVAGSPVTTSGTLAVSKATQSANTVYAGPTTGSAAAPTFRAVVPADLPLASSSAFGAVKVDGTTITAASGVISAVGGGSSGGVIGTANFSMATGAITKLHTGGVISGVTFLSTGKFRVTLSPSQTNFSVSFSASDDNTTAMMIYFAGTPDFSVATASFDVYTFGYSGNTARNFVQVTVMIAQL